MEPITQVGWWKIQDARRHLYSKCLLCLCVMLPLAPDLRASYAILDVGTDSFQVSHRRVEYDHKAVIDAVRRAQHPAARFIIEHQMGKKTVEGLMKSAKARRHMLKTKR
jgi:hypothetical protein